MAWPVEELALEYVMLKDDRTNYTLGGIHTEVEDRLGEIWDQLWELIGHDAGKALKQARETLKLVNHFPS